MKVKSTSGDIRRLAFVEELYKQLRQQTQSAIEEHDSMIAKASDYLKDGVTEAECAELLVIDGINRDSAESYVKAAKSDSTERDGLHEYSFQFEDVYGKIWSSYDVNQIIQASTDQEAWDKSENKIFSDPSIEPERIVSVNRIS
jgi:hypothetical protein